MPESPSRNGPVRKLPDQFGAELPAVVRLTLQRVAVGDDVRASDFGDALAASVDVPTPARDVVLGSLMTAAMTCGDLAENVIALIESGLGLDRRAPSSTVSGTDRPVILLAGSGKKGERTLNVSTPAALVAAAAGARVIKVGSAATSSALGSRDLVRRLGITECTGAKEVQVSLAQGGFAFVAVEPAIPSVDSLYGGRFHTVNPFSFGLAPLASPVRGDLVLFGLAHPRVDVAARVLAHFGVPNASVIATRTPAGNYLDEIAASGEFRRCGVESGRVTALERQSVEELIGEKFPHDLPAPANSQDSVERTCELLGGGGLDSHRRLVSINAGYLLVLSGLTNSVREGMRMAEEVLRSGAALDVIGPAGVESGAA